MRILGFPIITLIYDFIIPFAIIGWMFYYCWRTEKQEAQEKENHEREQG